jgi:soluble lytic murein transglycosylase-like protein
MMRWWCLLLAGPLFAQSRESIEKQLQSVARQRESLRQQSGTAVSAAPPLECEPIEEKEIAPLIESAAKAQALPPKLLRAVVAQESAFHSCAVSGKGARGLMQLMPATSEELGVKDPFDPKENVDAGAKFLRALLEKYKGDLPQALGAYNAGSETVDKAGGIPDIPETKAYIDAIVEKMGIKRIDLPSIPMPKPTGN